MPLFHSPAPVLETRVSVVDLVSHCSVSRTSVDAGSTSGTTIRAGLIVQRAATSITRFAHLRANFSSQHFRDILHYSLT